MKFDDRGWHEDGAIEAGQPPEQAFAHIGLYLQWLIRNDLHHGEFFQDDHVAAVRRGEMVGSDLADDVDGKLVDSMMSREGAAFSTARYRAYLDGLSDAFPDVGDYALLDDAATYGRVGSLLDAMYAEWVREGRPARPDVAEGPAESSTDAVSNEQRFETVVGYDDARMPHVAPETEALLAGWITSPTLHTSSTGGSRGGALLTRALKRLGVAPRDATVINGMGGSGRDTLVVVLFDVPGAAADRLLAEFASVIARPRRSDWVERHVAGRRVMTLTGPEFTTTWWARDGVVTQVSGSPEQVERAAALLP